MFQETLEAMTIMGFTEEEQTCKNCYQDCILQVVIYTDPNAPQLILSRMTTLQYKHVK